MAQERTIDKRKVVRMGKTVRNSKKEPDKRKKLRKRVIIYRADGSHYEVPPHNKNK